jgi:hypothetical protein
MSERISAADIRLPSGGIVSVEPPLRHHDAVQEARRMGHMFGEIRGAEEGYLTTHGRFVGRRDAAALADRIGQRVGRVGELLESEEVW